MKRCACSLDEHESEDEGKRPVHGHHERDCGDCQASEAVYTEQDPRLRQAVGHACHDRREERGGQGPNHAHHTYRRHTADGIGEDEQVDHVHPLGRDREQPPGMRTTKVAVSEDLPQDGRSHGPAARPKRESARMGATDRW